MKVRDVAKVLGFIAHTRTHTCVPTGSCVRVSILTAKGFKLSARSLHILLLLLLF